ncbi:MAG: type II toxin-antitoxin system RelE/ParE family toxin [Pseudonocardiaceae bacterium]
MRKLPEKIATACVEFIRAVLAEDPYRVGKLLTSSWEGIYSGLGRVAGPASVTGLLISRIIPPP